MTRNKHPAGMFGSEYELTEKLIEVARAAGFKAHPECNRWDVLLVCRETADQIGVHAKLRPNVDVIDQATRCGEHEAGPVVHAALVPITSRSFQRVAKMCRVHVIEGVHLGRFDLRQTLAHAQRWQHRSREWEPEVEVSTPAGVPSPRRVTPWKLSAVKLCLLARGRGFVTLADFQRLNLDPAWWFDEQFGPVMRARTLELNGEVLTRRGEYVLADPSNPLVPDFMWPEIVDALEQGDLEHQREFALEETTREVVIDQERRGPRERIRRSDVRPKVSATMLPPPTAIPAQPMPRLKAPVNVNTRREVIPARVVNERRRS